MVNGVWSLRIDFYIYLFVCVYVPNLSGGACGGCEWGRVRGGGGATGVATAGATVRVRYARGAVTRDVAPGGTGKRIRDASEIKIYTPLLSVRRCLRPNLVIQYQ